MIDRQGTIAFFAALAKIFAHEEQPLNALDAAIGDGDHGSTMLRGMLAASATAAATNQMLPGAIFIEAGTAFQKATGGAGGTVFAQIFKAIGAASGENQTLSPSSLAQGLTAASAQVQKLGRAHPGGKTMLDALEPAAKVLAASASLNAGVQAARAGAEATKEMTASIGRARFVAEGGKGHLDPGARSVVLILEGLERQDRPGAENS